MTKEKISPAAWNLISFSAIIMASLACYWSASDIFFVADDFVWLERAKYTVTGETLSIFMVDGNGLYFDPLVYLSFWLNYILNGLDPTWYHRFDLFAHTANALLVGYLALLLTKSNVAALFSGLIFAVSPTNADSVLWPSDRVDTLAALFYLSSIVSYMRYKDRHDNVCYLLSVVLFAISLSAKSTPVILPAIILTLERVYYTNNRYKDVLLRVAPFFLISIFYLALLFYASPKVETSQGVSGLNTKEFLRGIAVLFFPESLIAGREGLYTILSTLLLISISLFGMFAVSFRSYLVIFMMIASIIVPVLFLKVSFVYATPSNPDYYVLGSICHRIYLAVTGFSILMGTTTAFLLEKSKKHKVLWYNISIFLIAVIFYYGHSYVKEREGIWRSYARQYTDYAWMIKSMPAEKRDMSGYSSLYLIGSPFRSFTQSIIRVYSENGDLVVKHVRHYSEIPDVVSSSERSAVWALGKTVKFVDVTEEVRGYQRMLNMCGNMPGEEEKRECREESSRVRNRLNALILF